MASTYPGTLDTFATNRADATTMATTHALDHNNANDAVNKIEAELGVSPSGSYATLLARLDALQTEIDGLGGGGAGPVMLAGKSYDPTTAVSKSNASLLAMTAVDTTNLRLTSTAPANGTVLVKMRTSLHGTAGTPMILLGVLDGSTVRGRQAPFGWSGGTAGNQRQIREAEFLVTGLTPSSSYTWDAAYAVQVVNASSSLKYGGPNDTGGDNAFGAFNFSVWSTPNLLAGKNYDPGTAGTLVTDALLAMTAIDTTNLRLTFTAPASGRVFVRMQTIGTGATGTRPQVLLGVLSGSTVLGRVASGGISQQIGAGVTTDFWIHLADFLVTGLTPSSSYSLDAAYGVELVLASSVMKYGGPNGTAGADAWGGFAYEVWTA